MASSSTRDGSSPRPAAETHGGVASRAADGPAGGETAATGAVFVVLPLPVDPGRGTDVTGGGGADGGVGATAGDGAMLATGRGSTGGATSGGAAGGLLSVAIVASALPVGSGITKRISTDPSRTRSRSR